MEDFDYIDALAQKELSDRTMEPSADGWSMVQQKMKRKKRKKLFMYFIVVLALLSSLGIYIGVNSIINIETNSIVNKNEEQQNANDKNNSENTINIQGEENALSDSTSDSNSTSNASTNSIVNGTSQKQTHALGTRAATHTNNSHQATDNFHGDKNDVTQTQTGIHSRFINPKNNTSYNDSNTQTNTSDENQFGNTQYIAFADDGKNNELTAFGVKLYDWQLIAPETLKKKHKQKEESTEHGNFHKNLDVTLGLNGFFTSDAYDLARSFFVEVSYTDNAKLKYNYYFNYGASLQYRNLYLKQDTNNQNRGEVSINVLSNIEKRFGNFGISGGVYLGYEVYSPNNNLREDDVGNLFKRKFNYGVATSVRYKRIALVFKYELTPFINYLGEKQYEGFSFGVKYDF